MEISVVTLCGAYMMGFAAGRGKGHESLGDFIIAKELMSGEPSMVVLRNLEEIGLKMSDRKTNDDPAK